MRPVNNQLYIFYTLYTSMGRKKHQEWPDLDSGDENGQVEVGGLRRRRGRRLCGRLYLILRFIYN